VAESIPVAFVIPAAGTSSRFSQSFDSPVKKEFVLMQGTPVLRMTLTGLYSALRGTRFMPAAAVITCTPGYLEETKAAAGPHSGPLVFIEGGATRQESVLLGLLAVSEQSPIPPAYVCIHDASRPWASASLIVSTFEAAVTYGGAAPAVALIDALKSVDEQGFISGHHNRSRYVGIQTPQTFRFPDILTAHREARKEAVNYHDDTEIFTRWGGTVKTVRGEAANRKITYAADIPPLQPAG
jgi:2-C-methyl-D-erythritol 4-phosphate cytidylyltransferase